MSLADQANNGWLRPHKSSAQEIADLLAIVERDLADAGGSISADWRFGIAYNGALKLCAILLHWQHNAEGLRVFNAMGLSDPYDSNYRMRARCYAGFYMNEDPGAPNYDPNLKLIRSMINGSRGPFMWGGLPPDLRARALFSNLRYFDPIKRRGGISEDVAALVDGMTGDSVTVTLVNVNQIESRELVVQAGGYAEHQFDAVEWNGQTVPLDAREFTVRLGPGAGGKLALKLRRFVNQPTVAFPWDHN